jgi:hypothetical protein
MQENMDRLRRSFGHGEGEAGDVETWAIPLDVVQEGDNIVVKASVPGVNPEDIDVSIENDVLTIKGQMYWLVSSVTLLYTEVCNTESLALSIGAGLRPAPTPTNSGSERYTGLCTVGCYRGM